MQTASFSSFFSLKVADFNDMPSKPQPDKQAAIKHLCDILVDPKQRNVSCAMLFKPSLINYTRKKKLSVLLQVHAGCLCNSYTASYNVSLQLPDGLPTLGAAARWFCVSRKGGTGGGGWGHR